ncbi:unnamed protein product [Sphagnum compactum]
MDAQGIDYAREVWSGLPSEAALNKCDGAEKPQERGSAFENDFSKDGANETGESSNQKTQIGNGIEVGVGDSTSASRSDQMEKLIHHETSPVITTCNSKLLPSEIQPADGPKAGVLLPLSIEGVHLLSSAQAICQSPTTVKYPAGNEEASNVIESTLQIFDQHVNVANLARALNNPVTIKESEDTKEILKKKASKVPIPESTKLASENVAIDVLESGNDTSFESNDLEEALAAKQMVSNLWKTTKMHNDTLQALG